MQQFDLPPDREALTAQQKKQSKTGTRIYEPHEWNAKIVARQKKRGEARNIPLLPDAVRRTHTMTDKAPKMRDPRKLAKMVRGPDLELGDSGSDPTDLDCGSGK